MLSSAERADIENRIDNWRRYYRPAMRIMSVPYYTPPAAGEVMQDNQIVKIPLKIQDAVLLETKWRAITHPHVKWWLKWNYIVRVKDFALWRKMKNYGVKIRNNAEHEEFDKIALHYFYRQLI